MKNFSPVYTFFGILILLINVLILDQIDTKICRSFSLYRIFTMNSTICSNITLCIKYLEKTITAIILMWGSMIFSKIMNNFTLTSNSTTTNQQIKYGLK